MALLCDIIEKEPSTYEEAAEKKEWKYSMIEEYQSIMKNDVWEIVLRPKGKLVVSSEWIYKIKHAANGSIENTRQGLWHVASPRKKALIMRRHLH